MSLRKEVYTLRLFNGNSIVNQIVFGKILVYKKNNFQIRKLYVENIEKEILRLEKVINEVKEELEESYQYALKNATEADALIFKVQSTLLDDEDYIEEIENLIRSERVNGEIGRAHV